MPTYTVHAPAGRLTLEQKERLACEITRVHNKHTGAQTFFAQVIFLDLPSGCWYVGGAAIDAAQIHVNGQVRSGRSNEVKQALLANITEVVSSVSGAPTKRIWVYLTELPASHMVEYGHVLPEPGGESDWLAALPAEDQDFMQSIRPICR